MLNFPGIPGGMRAAENSLATQWSLGIDTLVQGVVLGTPSDDVFPGEQILPDRSVDSLNFLWPVLGKEHLRLHDAKRALRAEHSEGNRAVSYASDTVERFSWKTGVDVAEIRSASIARPAFNLRRDGALYCRRIVRTAIEWERRALLVTAGTYSFAYDLSTGTGDLNYWNGSSGNSFKNIWNAISAISNATGVQPSKLTLYLSQKAYLAFLMDPVFTARKGGLSQSLTGAVSMQEIAAYFGIGKVWTANPVVANDAGGVDPMYDNVAILYLDTNSGLDRTFGDYIPGVTFRWNDGVTAQSWYDNDRTSWYEAWNEWAKPKIFSATTMALFTNVGTFS